jgi:hypothetical protein
VKLPNPSTTTTKGGNGISGSLKNLPRRNWTFIQTACFKNSKEAYYGIY